MWLTPILLWFDLLEAKSFRSLLLIEAKFGLMVPAMAYVPPPRGFVWPREAGVAPPPLKRPALWVELKE